MQQQTGVPPIIRQQVQPAVFRSFIGGLGGKDISPAEFDHVLQTLQSANPHDGSSIRSASSARVTRSCWSVSGAISPP